MQAYFCDVDERPKAHHFSFDVGQHTVALSPTEDEVRTEVADLDLCTACVCRELLALVMSFDYAAKRAWIEKVKSAQGAIHGR
jgi:hypothetical protein